MDRRFVIWLALSYMLLVFFWPRTKQPPVEKPQKQPAAAADAVADRGDAAGNDAAGNATDRDGDDPKQRAADAGHGEIPEQEDAEPLWVTLGSLDQDSEYQMLVTLTNRGAAVERIELANPRYGDLQDRGGYLGHLATDPSPDDGLAVRAVGAGTPAANAGLQVGDRITMAGSKGKLEPVDTEDALLRQLSARRPGQPFTLAVVRDGKPIELQATLAKRPLEVIRPESENVLLWSKKLPMGFVEPPSFQLTLDRIGERMLDDDAEELPGVDLKDATWRLVDQDETSSTFERRLPELGVQVTKRYQIAKKSDGKEGDQPGDAAYDLTLDVTIENLSDEPQSVAYRLDGPNGLPIEGWWYANKIGHSWGAAGLRDVMVRNFGASIKQFAPANIAVGDLDPIEGAPLAYAGVDAQYFSVDMIPQKLDADALWIERTELKLLGPEPPPRSSEGRYANVTPQLISISKPLAPLNEQGDKFTHSYQIFAGPKRPELLDKYQAVGDSRYSLRDLITYGWFSAIAKAMLSVLHFFYSIVGNYGVAIILLTVLVRSCMFPLSRKQAQSMMRMQELRPEMERIKEKYKQDMQKQSQAMQELYRKNGVNPLAGCLPMLIQLPVFVGLYRGLAVDVELRQASLFGESVRWCSNLAAPDMFLDWSGVMPEFINRGQGMLGLGPYLNVLPLVTVALFLLQQKLFMPEPANEQAAMQQKIMKYMMVVMGVLFYKVPSGLCLYFIASSVWGIAERKLLPKPPTDGSTAVTTPPAPDRLSGRRTSEKPAKSNRAGKNGKAGGSKRSKSKRKR